MASSTCSAQKVHSRHHQNKNCQHTSCDAVSDHVYPMLDWRPGRACYSSDANATIGAGPFPLDLGDSLYAPNCFKDGSGRRLMLGWFQELGARGPASESTYSGCLTLPRVLSRRGAAWCLAGRQCAYLTCRFLSDVAP